MNRPENRTRPIEWILAVCLMLLATAAGYLLLANRLGFYLDDWYLAYTGHVAGSEKFTEIFAIDRPFRAGFVGWVFDLFGLNAPLYSYLSALLRLLGGLAFFWLVRLTWPERRRLAVPLSVLFVVYPGWMEQPAAFDYQSHLLSLALIVFSIALSVKAVRAARGVAQAGLLALAVALQVTGLLLMEYYIGMEGLRIALIVYLAFGSNLPAVFQQVARPAWRANALRALGYSLPFLITAAGFLFWRTVIFSNTRAATDIGGMIAGLLGDPVLRGLWSLVYLVQDFLNVVFFAWAVPVYQTVFALRLRDALMAVGLGVAFGLLAYAAARILARAASPAEQEPGPSGRDMIILGTLGVVAALIPIILGSRHVVFPTFSRFTLPASAGALLVIGGLVDFYLRERLRTLLPAVLIGLAVMMQYANTAGFANRWESMRDFWWQVSWRAPDIESGTLLVADYAGADIPEDYLVWGPANLIYYPELYTREKFTLTPLGALVPNQANLVHLQTRKGLSDRERRGILSPQDPDKALVLSQPAETSCVHAFDGLAAEISDLDDRLYRAAEQSRIDVIDPDAPPHIPPAELFGPEPAHRWCYFYQKASLARQAGDWESAARYGDEALAQKEHAIDRVEWFPFLQAYAYLGRYEDVDRLAPIVIEIPFLKQQACALFQEDARRYGELHPAGQAYLVNTFCR